MSHHEGNSAGQRHAPAQIELFDLICVLWRGKYTIIACIVLGLAAASVYVFSGHQRWTSIAVIAPPEAGQVANYTNTMMAIYPTEGLRTQHDVNASFLPRLADVQSNIFERFTNLAAVLSERENISVENVKPVANQPLYRPLPLQLSATAESPEKARAALTSFISETDRLSAKQLSDDLLVNIESRERGLAASLEVQSRIAEEQKARRLAELKRALEQAKQSGIVAPQTSLSDDLPPDFMYLLGSDTLTVMLKNVSAQPLAFSAEYDNVREQILNLEMVKSKMKPVSTYSYVLEASTPSQPDATKGKQVFILAFLLSALCGVAILLLRNAIRNYRSRT